jgi:hypothetical protein
LFRVFSPGIKWGAYNRACVKCSESYKQMSRKPFKCGRGALMCVFLLWLAFNNIRNVQHSFDLILAASSAVLLLILYRSPVWVVVRPRHYFRWGATKRSLSSGHSPALYLYCLYIYKLSLLLLYYIDRNYRDQIATHSALQVLVASPSPSAQVFYFKSFFPWAKMVSVSPLQRQPRLRSRIYVAPNLPWKISGDDYIRWGEEAFDGRFTFFYIHIPRLIMTWQSIFREKLHPPSSFVHPFIVFIPSARLT